MTDKEILEAMFARLGAEAETALCGKPFDLDTELVVYQYAEKGAKGIGYSYFMAAFRFDENGRLIAVGGYE